MTSTVHVETKVELQRVDLNQVRQIVEGATHELLESLEILIALRPASTDELLLVAQVSESIEQAKLCTTTTSTRLARLFEQLGEVQREAAELRVAAYGAPAIELAEIGATA